MGIPELAEWLQLNFPLRGGYRLRFLKGSNPILNKAHGRCVPKPYSWDIVINAEDSHSDKTYTLFEEWAHARILHLPPSVHDHDHGPLWGVEHSRIIAAYWGERSQATQDVINQAIEANEDKA